MRIQTIQQWSSAASNWAYAFARPSIGGTLKSTPEDFKVVEEIDFQLDGKGEHVWLLVQKNRQNTEQVAKHLARHSGVAYKSVGYSGLKDFFAVTEQWFSICLPEIKEPNWSEFTMAGVSLLDITRHRYKLKRGTHRANRFSILIRNLSENIDELAERLELISIQGVPNYFGPQRFGRDYGNMQQLSAMFSDQPKTRNRKLYGILLSAGRSWLFNQVLSERIKAKTWQTLQSGEPANLDGSGSVFKADEDPQLESRLLELDIHPTGPLWGEVSIQSSDAFKDLFAWELEKMSDYRDIADGLVMAGLRYQRRPLRMKLNKFDWDIAGDQLQINFTLQKGQFATSVLRELIIDTGQPHELGTGS